ncbi:DDE-type integrase/transposase/recombinase [Weissella paramesenteroides]|uniref:DDE-type integrase/transposase/recombinase n=1 Tax=Weissella paramesenteroides TaxID=1249 RepID=UPI0023557081|nr:DDE-type integrase/transposase/recombinase [Weissella paramesenteroides]
MKQTFNATQPYTVIHTDVTQVRLSNQHWAYISVMTDEATKKVLAVQISVHPDKQLIMKTADQLCANFPTGTKSINHTDQGWHYQQKDY